MKDNSDSSRLHYSTDLNHKQSNVLLQRFLKFYDYLEKNTDWLAISNFQKNNLGREAVKNILVLIDLIQSRPPIVIKKLGSFTAIRLEQEPKKLANIKPRGKFDPKTVKKGRTIIERFKCFLTFLETQEKSVYISHISTEIKIDVNSVRNYLKICALVNSKPYHIIIQVKGKEIKVATYTFKKRDRIKIKRRIAH